MALLKEGMSDIAHIRHPYHGMDKVFDLDHLASRNPYKQFASWFEDAKNVAGIQEPNAMALATATKDGVPSVRTILLKSFSEKGFIFFSNYESKKGKELAENPRCSMMFYWEPQKRSIRIDGTVERLPEEDSKGYFDARPRDSRLGAMVSRQSTVVQHRQSLNKKFEELCEQYKDETKPIPKPSYWGGYVVTPYSFEFWQGQTNRLHDRLVFRKLSEGETFDPELMTKGEDGWIIERLSP